MTPASHRHLPEASALAPDGVPVPDFRNLGVLLRILLLVNLGCACAALLVSPELRAIPGRFVEFSVRVQPLLLVVLGLLALLSPVLSRFAAPVRRVCLVGMVTLLGVLFEWGLTQLGLGDWSPLAGIVKVAVLSAVASWAMLHYLELRHRAVRPAVSAAQLAALTARIRPHFLFNSLNAVLSLIRKEPQRAEAALESLADLFRVLMKDPRDLVPLSGEIALCRQYLDLERLRLGERLQVEWIIDDVPGEAFVPPLMLQPLLENAVYHGIEAADQGGVLKIHFARQGDRLVIAVENPFDGQRPYGGGSQLALDNIRQRLALHYDLEASLKAESLPGKYRVTVVIPVSAERR